MRASFYVRHATILLLTSALAPMLSGFAAGDVIAVAATEQGSIGTLDLTTGAYTSTGSSGVTSIVGMGFIGNTLYGVQSDPTTARFYSINTSTGVATFINTLPVSAYGGTAGFGVFLGVTQGNPGFGFAATALGNLTATLPLTYEGHGLITFDPGLAYMYLSANTGGLSDELHQITSATLAQSDVGSLGAHSIAGVIVGDTLYSTDGSNLYTYIVSPTSVSGILTTTALTGLNPGDVLSSLSLQPSLAVPEPSSMIVASLAIIAGGLVHAARRRYLAA